ncbi:cyclin-F-like isoform X2 [Hydractinia symbiolongicarpus]|uniref:cyclin-F-like isoform X2 n=1 Tax=Hydractinia symbiolongicarpus TaxID=13093 RepID=UPI00254B5D2D|nr:cyclin-F-like isoform X2 [Hydractinia symbiolongicarpus]
MQENSSYCNVGADARNHECLVKLGLAHLYHYNLTASAEKTVKEVKYHASLSANYLCSLDNRIVPKKPITWMLLRPPWSTAKSICLKQAVHNQMLKFKGSNADKVVCYNLGKVLNLDNENESNDIKAKENLSAASLMGFTHAKFEILLQEEKSVFAKTDVGAQLQWFRDLQACAANGNTDARFKLCQLIASHNSEKFLCRFEAIKFSKALFRNSDCSHIEKLENYQPKINSLMRCILVDWIAEVAYMKDMSHQVLHAAVHYIDSFLMTRVVERTKLQLLGITCLLLAAKSHYDPRQVHILTVRESSWLTDQTYQYEDVVRMMGEVMGTLKADLWRSTSSDYLELLLSSPLIRDIEKDLVHYLHDLSLQYTVAGTYKRSVIAASVLFLARLILNIETPWPSELSDFSGFLIRDIANCTAILYYKCFICPSVKDDRDLPLRSIKEEYLSPKHSNIANLTFPQQLQLKSRILAADCTLSCVSEDPLQFVVMSLDIDETFNASVRSIDYYGDYEDFLDHVSDSSCDEESFCVGRTQISSFRSVDEFSDDETTMDAESLNYGSSRLNQSKESFTPIYHSKNVKAVMIEKSEMVEFKYINPLNEKSVFLFPEESCHSQLQDKTNAVLPETQRSGLNFPIKRKHSSLHSDICSKQHRNNVVGKRTR